MPENSWSNGQNKKTDIERIADFMSAYLGGDIGINVEYPPHLRKDYDYLNDKEKKEWQEITFQAFFRYAVAATVEFVQRGLTEAEAGLVRRKIVIFLNQAGYEYIEN